MSLQIYQARDDHPVEFSAVFRKLLKLLYQSHDAVSPHLWVSLTQLNQDIRGCPAAIESILRICQKVLDWGKYCRTNQRKNLRHLFSKPVAALHLIKDSQQGFDSRLCLELPQGAPSMNRIPNLQAF